MSEPQPIKLPERVRKTISDSYTDLQEMNKEFSKELAKAQKALNASVTIAVEMLGLDPALNHTIDFATGIITPAPTATGPTLVKEEATEERVKVEDPPNARMGRYGG